MVDTIILILTLLVEILALTVDVSSDRKHQQRKSNENEASERPRDE